MSDAGPIHAFLAGRGLGSGRLLEDVIAFDDGQIERVRDFIPWCFPFAEASRAVPGAPVLTPSEAEAIRADDRAKEGLRAALERMSRFYAETDGWLRGHDHNHLRITRIITATRELLGQDEATAFHDLVTERNDAAGLPIDRGSLTFWLRALRG